MNTVQDNLMYCDLVSVNGIIHKVGVDGNCFRIVDAEGIPITPEILKKNDWYWGFTSDEKKFKSCVMGAFEPHWVYDKGAGEIPLYFDKDTDGGALRIADQRFNRRLDFFWCDTLYVHELQRALRLCGLDELANNFKI